jgi:hypothetical protein
MPLPLISGKDLQGLATDLTQTIKGQVQSPRHRFVGP